MRNPKNNPITTNTASAILRTVWRRANNDMIVLPPLPLISNATAYHKSATRAK